MPLAHISGLSKDRDIQMQIGNYEILEKLGDGQQGVVYKARHVGSQAIVALKVLKAELAKVDAFVRRFHREANVMMSFDHPYLVKAHEVGEAKGYHFVTMEFVDGEPLVEKLRRKEYLDEGQALYVAKCVSEGLKCAWEKTIVHRDIKPANIMIQHDGRIRLMDMGLAKSLADKGATITLAGGIVGSPAYASPEQLEGRLDVDVRTDIYALGTTLFHLVCGRQPFIGPSAGVVASKNLSEPLPNPRELNPDLSDPFCSFLIKLTEKKEEDRYQTPDEVIHAIDQILSGVATVQSPAARDDASATQSRPVRSTFLGRNRTPILASLGLLLAVGAAAAFLHLRNRDDQPRRLIRRKTPERSTSLSPGGRAFIAGTGVKENPDRPQPKPVTIRGSSKAQWQVLDPLQYSSTGGSTMKKLADHSVLATGIIPLGNSFQVVARTDIPKITAIRLEVLTHENFKVRSLSYESGSYLVTTFEASIKRERQPMANIPFEPRQAVSDYVYRKPIWRVDKAVDGDKLTGWSGTSSKVSRYANQRTAVFYPAQSVLAGRGTTLVISILNDRADRESMGRFRLAVSSASSPKWNGSSSVPVKLDAKVLE